MILGLDIGGANTKVTSADGNVVKSIYLPLWKEAPLLSTLREIAETYHPKAVGVVMTGELADCYPDKISGVQNIFDTVTTAFDCPTFFWGLDGFTGVASPKLAAANWSASSTLLGADIGDCIFVDMGSTTTDIIPIKDRPLASNTDYQRLGKGELIYTGLLRSNLISLLRDVEIDGFVTPLSSELFAITADAYVATGIIREDEYTCETPDGDGKDKTAAMRRLVRTVCSDLDEIGEHGALCIANQAIEAQIDLVARGIARSSVEHDLKTVVIGGIGEGVLRKACEILELESRPLSKIYGSAISHVFPAYAVARLLETYFKRTNANR